jgi:hypothetical protein
MHVNSDFSDSGAGEIFASHRARPARLIADRDDSVKFVSVLQFRVRAYRL